MAAAMANLTREVNRKKQHRHQHTEEPRQNSENGGAENSAKEGDQSRGTVT